MTRTRLLGVLVYALGLLGPASLAHAQGARSQPVEIVEVDGPIDGPVEGAIRRTIDEAERRHGFVVLQIDSAGVIGADRAERLVDEVLRARVPVVTWIGPPGARASDGAAFLALSGHVRAMAPATRLSADGIDLRSGRPDRELYEATLSRIG